MKEKGMSKQKKKQEGGRKGRKERTRRNQPLKDGKVERTVKEGIRKEERKNGDARRTQRKGRKRRRKKRAGTHNSNIEQ